MAFFDRMSETLANKSRDVAGKAKELAEVTSLSSKVSGKEYEMRKLFSEIGELVFTNRENWRDLDLEERFERLEEMKEEIGKLKAEINDLKGVKYCPKCGAELNKDVSFCSRCGLAVTEVEED